MGGEEAIGKAVAFTKGPDIYLVDRTFAPNGETTTRMDLTGPSPMSWPMLPSIDRLTTSMSRRHWPVGSTRWIRPQGRHWCDHLRLQLVGSIRAQTRWKPHGSCPRRSRLPAITAEPGPGEDMAEAVSMVVLGRSNWIPATHTRWVEQWLGTGATILASGKPWAPAGSREVLSRDPLYDEAALNGIAVRFDHAEPLYFSLPDDTAPHAQLAADIQIRLLERRLSGVLSRTDDDRLPRYAGLFSGTRGVSLWVELWDFREATGFQAADPILAYVVLW